jgi:hypothetical protein
MSINVVFSSVVIYRLLMILNMHFTGLHNGWKQHLRVYIVYVVYKIKAGNVFVYTRGQRTDAGTGNGNVFGIL